ncbi:unnamed protein product [Didymodactylos carnosus]|uniref:PIPK domain-containing protein n=1 Tax=Didymodactylos carnosus TaxID=1234261 RepID=A0A814FUG8_9BILA|nr:unnamed protein product [Didymodactylos carnosus]CAF3757372.1 unnamed protein product [Didymodactylos carnosus]
MNTHKTDGTATAVGGEDEEGDGVDIGKLHKLGHIRVDNEGNVTFKRLPITQLVEALQLGIQYTVGGLQAKAARDVLYKDFITVEIIHFPNDFTIRSYAPVAFRHFRELFNIKPEEFLNSICKPLRELRNPGASGSLFYLTSDDEFILKTVQKKEAEFLKSLLPGYYMNVTQNPRTLLPKYFGLYCYQVTEFMSRKHEGSVGENKNIRVIVMNNLIPSQVHMHEKYDLKGSTYKRRASSQERQKESPTWKDLDFIERHPDGFLLDVDTYNAVVKTVQRDCRVLESFRIMDYSFLIGVHHVDPAVTAEGGAGERASDPSTVQPPKRMMYSTPMDTINAEFEEHNKPDDHLVETGGIPARTASGQRLLLYVGIIDILQSYRIRKQFEHAFKSVFADGATISVTNPSFYSERFQSFLFNTVFKKAPREAGATKKFRTIALLALRGSPPKRRSRLSKLPTQTEQDISVVENEVPIPNVPKFIPTERRTSPVVPRYPIVGNRTNYSIQTNIPSSSSNRRYSPQMGDENDRHVRNSPFHTINNTNIRGIQTANYSPLSSPSSRGNPPRYYHHPKENDLIDDTNHMSTTTITNSSSTRYPDLISPSLQLKNSARSTIKC